MTDITDILTDNWDTDIVAIPDIIKDDLLNRRFFQRVVATRISTTLDELAGITERRYFDADSHDAHITFIEGATESDVRLMIKGIKKICATYTPVPGEENILQWSGGEWEPFNGVRYMFKFILLIRKSGYAGY
ncbi:hypothetical protein LCGC14_0956550 [marine sediment metagenome]|uniref:Uncharacterized protein n=1 Tax=marine sediment metagenome TaxID=412755 RepID=A0A0F9RM72_9ZZZZ|nr:hypothetical protein [bacterium]